MAQRTCHNCVYACWDAVGWLRRLATGEPLVPRCANHPHWPGELHDVPGVPCRNYQPRPPEPQGDLRRIPLGNGHYALVDATDYEWLSKYNWHYHNGYAVRREQCRRIYMHRDIMKPPEGMSVDHINHDKLDHRRCNLRVCTHQQNVHNNSKHKGSSSRFKGVGYLKERGKWFAKGYYQGERIWLGYFEDEAEAARAYDRMAVQYFREFAKLNFPQEWPPERRQEIYDKYPTPPAKPKKPLAKTQSRKRKTKKTLAKAPSRKGSKRKTKKAT